MTSGKGFEATIRRWIPASLAAAAVLLVLSGSAEVLAEGATAAPDESTPMGAKGGYAADLLWTVVAAILVFWMQAGFSLVEAGFTRAKNTVNILMKNITDFSVGTIAFWLLGFGLMFGHSGGWLGTSLFAHSPTDDVGPYAFMLFQTVFAATAATIVSGAMAERTKFQAYMVYSLVITAIIYPIFGGWAWNGLASGMNGGTSGWLEAGSPLLVALGFSDDVGFIDFAGSTVVHSVGGWAALAGAIVLGPRLGKFGPDGEPRPLPGHNLVLAVLGMFILWMGWFGFNAGSTTAVIGGGDAPFGGSGKAFALIAFNTNLAAAAGAVSTIVVTWVVYKKPDVGIVLNGALAGLVAITAPCANVLPWAALVIGLVAGALVTTSVELVERSGVDDPVGAVSVHGVCGLWGTLAAGIFNVGGFSLAQVGVQALGALAAFVWTFGTAFALFQILKRTIGLRVDPEDEIEGLDLSEHGAEAYPADASELFMTAE